MRTLLIAATLLLAAPLLAQEYYPGYYYAPYFPGVVETPEIHLGSLTEPSLVTVPPVIVQTSEPYAPPFDNVAPANLDLLASRNFDFVIAPVHEILPGSMYDTHISLGEYARHLRAEKRCGPPPKVLTLPPNSH